MKYIWRAFVLLFVMVSPVPASGGNGFILPQFSQRISLDFKSADLKDVLKAFSVQIGANFIVRPDVTARPITVFLDNVPVEEAFSKVLSVNGLGYDYDESMNLFVIKILAPEITEKPVTRVFQLRYASVDSSKLKVGGGGFTAALSPALSDKGKIVDNARMNSLVITDIASNFPNIEKMLARLDVPVKQVIIEVEMLDVSKSTGDTVGAKFNLNASFSGTSRNGFFPFNEDNITAKGGGPIAVASNATAVDFSGSKLALDFIKSKSDSKTLARPRIVTMDNETATIQISTDEAIGLVQQNSTYTPSATQQAERAKTGVFLSVTPQVNPLTEEITMAIEPKVIDANSKVIFGTATFFNPEERGMKVSLRVPNGKTIVIGGLLRRTVSDDSTSVPFLGSIPFLGKVFDHHDRSNRERELMVFLTPHVVDADLFSTSGGNAFQDHAEAAREQSSPDSRRGLIEREMDSVTSFRQP